MAFWGMYCRLVFQLCYFITLAMGLKKLLSINDKLIICWLSVEITLSIGFIPTVDVFLVKENADDSL